VFFALNISMVHSPKLVGGRGGKHQTGISFTLGETIHFGSLEFIAGHFGPMRLSSKENDSGIVFIGMVHNRSSSLHAILEDSIDEGEIASSRGRSSSFPISQEFNMVTPTIPITTTQLLEGNPMTLAIAAVSLCTVVQQLDTRLPPE
jgi:hypothetical protein